jgi:hypothetical protein
MTVSSSNRTLRLAFVSAWATVSGGGVSSSFAAPTPPDPLVVEATISLGGVRGRIDHLAIGVLRERLFVAELGNDARSGSIARNRSR